MSMSVLETEAKVSPDNPERLPNSSLYLQRWVLSPVYPKILEHHAKIADSGI